MDYIEWLKYKKNPDTTPICPGYILNDKGDRFIMEPGFYNQLQSLKNLHPDKYELVIQEINNNAIKKHKVFYCVDFEKPFIDLKDYVYNEITDILNPMKIFVEDKSRGSDYGD